jgi:hypothetical protein
MALLGFETSWEDRDYGRVALVSDGVVPPGSDRRLDPPTLVVVAWLPPGERRPRRLKRLLTMELNRAPVRVGSALLLANAEPAGAERLGIPVVHVGPEQLGRLVDENAELRLRMPSLLGIREFDAPAEVVARSTADIAAARDLARVFVPTAAYARAVAVLRTHHFAVLTGPPEMGKTASARMVALAQLTAGWEVHECIRPEQLWAVYASDRPQVFVADDAFGSTEYRPDAAERWAVELARVLRAMDDRHWLIWTSRPAPLKAGLGRVHREHGVERFPQPAEIHVDAAALEVDEKALILFRHAKAAALPRSFVGLVQRHGWTIVSHRHFTPERIRRFVRERLAELATAPQPVDIAAAVAEEIREPTTAMAASYAALGREHRAVLVGLLDAAPEPVAERDLAAAIRRHSDVGLSRAPRELVDRLTDHFLRVVPPASIAWVHPSWRDLVITELSGDEQARRGFLERSELEGILLALSIAGGASGERALPFLRDDADWDIAGARVTRLLLQVDNTDTIRLLEALEVALGASMPGRVRAEAQALARLTLEKLAAKWDDARAPVPVAALEGWFTLAARMFEPPPAPRLGPSWIDLLPTEAVDLTSRADLVRFDDWLALADVLASFAPYELERLGFPQRQDHVFARFVLDAAARAPEETEELVTRILRRIRTLVPAHSPAAHDAVGAVASRPDPWFEVEFETHPRRWEPRLSDQVLVERVLRDLG